MIGLLLNKIVHKDLWFLSILPDTVIGKNKGPIPTEKPASTMLLPMMSPIAISHCLFRTAVKSTTSSSREVPIATLENLFQATLLADLS